MTCPASMSSSWWVFCSRRSARAASVASASRSRRSTTLNTGLPGARMVCWVPSARKRVRSMGCAATRSATAFSSRAGSIRPPSNST
ncbi:Uncharacterised protein [Mycobacteroides abscessus subsp. abscessus]|nr:Uncharacterised protein [Mycobacteroides abscessus subsp. abscessus]